MKSTVALLALAASLTEVSATFRHFPPFKCPSGIDNTCVEKQKIGFEFEGLVPGNFDRYNDFNFKGWTCKSKQPNKNTIEGECGPTKEESPSFGHPDKPFSVDIIDVTPEIDCDLEFHYEMPDGASCKQRSFCSKQGSSIKNTQCGGARKVTVVYPKQKFNIPKNKCKIKVDKIKFDCDKNQFPPTSPPPPVVPSTTLTTLSTLSTVFSSPPVSSVPVPSSPPVQSEPPRQSEPASSAPPQGNASSSAPPVESSPAVSSPPAVESSPAVSSPAVSSPPAVESSPAVSSPAVSSPPAVESSPAVSSPAVSSPPAVESSPAVSSPAVSSPPAVESSPAVSSPAVSSPAVSSPAESSPAQDTSSAPPSETNPLESSPPVESQPPVSSPPVGGQQSSTTSDVVPVTSEPPVIDTTVFQSTSTIFTTSVTTVTDCGPEKPECNGGETPVVVTVTIPQTTTVCDVTTTFTRPATVVPPKDEPTTLPAVPTAAPPTPNDDLPCDPVVPRCLITWLPLLPDCKDNTDAKCFCPKKEFVEKVFQCLYAHGETDEIVEKAVQFVQGICAEYAPENPAVVTGADSITEVLTVTATPTEGIKYTTITLDTTITESATTTVVKTTIAVPEVGFTVTASDIVPIIPTAEPIQEGGSTPSFVTPPVVGTGGIPVPSSTGDFPQAAGAGKLTSGLTVAFAVMIAMAAF